MIERARANADRAGNGDQRQPSFLVGDVAALAFPDGSFDLVVSTLSMHHWPDPAAGLAEIGRVLRCPATPVRTTSRAPGSAILLPDGTVFVCGGIQRCSTHEPTPGRRWRRCRPAATTTRSHCCCRVGRLAVTHQTDTEQKILELPFTRTGFSTFGTIDTNGGVTDRFGVGNNLDALCFAPGDQGYGPNLFHYLRRDVTGLAVTAPDGGVPHSLAQQGYSMLFALNNNGVPSIATWLCLQ